MSHLTFSPRVRRFLTLLCLSAVVIQPVSADAAEYKLAESSTDGRAFTVDIELAVNGTLLTPLDKDKTASLPLKVTAKLNYDERRLPSAGRGARALRALRHYNRTDVEIQVQDRLTRARLPEKRRLIIAEGYTSGIQFYHPEVPLTYNELELLNVPGDPLAVAALLPPTAVDVGDNWSPEKWVLQMLTGTEALEEGELNCRLVSVESNQARVTFKGSLEGATLGSRTTVTLEGLLVYDLRQRCITGLEISQSEKRPPRWTIAPGMDLTATVKWRRTTAGEVAALNDDLLDAVPLDPAKEDLRLRLQTPWNVRFDYSRDWHLLNQTENAVVIRLIEDGGLIAQCNLNPLPRSAPGEPFSPESFEKQIQEAIGDRLERIVSSEELQPAGKTQPFIYRVVASGRSAGRDLQWRYYLCADAGGRRSVAVFAVEASMLKRFGRSDLDIINTLRFTPESPGPISSSK